MMMAYQNNLLKCSLSGILIDMLFFERFVLALIGLALVCAVLLGAALAYHFFRFSPDHRVSIITISVYGGGVVVIALFTLAFVLF